MKSTMLALLFGELIVSPTLAALCTNWLDEEKCGKSYDGACQCAWRDSKCVKDKDACSDGRIGITTVNAAKKLGESCGSCFSETGDCGTCESGLLCECIGSCANPVIADIPNVCVEYPCPCGQMCRLSTASGTGICGSDNKTCSPTGGDHVQCPGQAQACILSDGATQVPIGWYGKDRGDNYCNHCSCEGDGLRCEEMACGNSTGQRGCVLADGSTEVANEWNGHDVGNNYCNTCTCNAGVLGCTKMGCSPKEKTEGESCGTCLEGDCGDCADNLLCVCVGDCADPSIADSTSICARAACPCNERCIIDNTSSLGTCLEDSKTCGQPVFAPQCTNVKISTEPPLSTATATPSTTVAALRTTASTAATTALTTPAPANCTLTSTGEQVAQGWSGRDTDGCNTCTCNDGALECTEMACAPVLSAGTALSVRSALHAVALFITCFLSAT